MSRARNAGFDYGGQAVIEGVMIRGPHSVAIAVRRPDQEIVVQRRPYRPLTRSRKLLSLPLVRGAVALYEALVLGIDALMFSANQAAETEEERITRGEMVVTMALSVAAAVLLFVLLPTWLVHFLEPAGIGTFGRNLAEGVLRLLVLLAYIVAIARMPDIRRVLQYHGAEHKVIHALERGDDLTVEAVRPYPVLHPRCGTSFLLLVALVSVLLFSFFGWPGLWQRLALRLALLPVVAGVAFEFLRASGRSRSPLWKPIVAPGLWLQRFTTREPDDDQIEVALCALRAALDDGAEVPA